MKSIFVIIFAILIASSTGYAGDSKILKAKPGKYNAVDIGEISKETNFSVKLKLTEYNQTPEWPPAAYVGLYQGDNRSDSVQFVIIRNKPTDKHVVAGYRVIESGRITAIKSLAKLELDTHAQVMFSVLDGVVKLSLHGVDPVEFKTNFDKVKPYISVSSGIAEYEISIGN